MLLYAASDSMDSRARLICSGQRNAAQRAYTHVNRSSNTPCSDYSPTRNRARNPAVLSHGSGRLQGRCEADETLWSAHTYLREARNHTVVHPHVPAVHEGMAVLLTDRHTCSDTHTRTHTHTHTHACAHPCTHCVVRKYGTAA